MEDRQRQIHVVMFPWLAHGHITPFLELAKRLHGHDLRISFVSTPVNITRIKQQLLQVQPVPAIDLVELPLPSVEGLPAGVESTTDLKRGGTVQLLIEALDRCEKPFEELLRRLSPDFVIHDMIQYWTPRVAARLGIPSIYFRVIGIAVMAFIAGQIESGLPNNPTAEDLMVQPPGFPSSIIEWRLFEAQRATHMYRRNQKGMSFLDRIIICGKESWAIACNTCDELEGAYMDNWRRTFPRPLIPVGILMPPLPPRPPAERCLHWLDLQAIRSVVFVSFGSECAPSTEEVASLALGLEETLMPFLWVLTIHDGGAALPRGFGDRTKGRGIVVTEWAPQLHVLSHPSTGAFVTHCGWNSVTEGLRFGVPFVALPMQYEQDLNARLIAEVLKVGVDVKRNDEDGSFSKEDIAIAVGAVMVGDESRQMKSNVAEMKEVLSSDDCKVHRTNMTNFVSFIKQKSIV